MSIRLSKGIKKMLERDPCQQLLNQLELVQEQADSKTLRKILSATQRRIRHGWIHVTDSRLPCDRLIAAALLGVSPPRSFIPPKTRRIFDNGTYMHYRYQNYFLHLPPPFEVNIAEILEYWPMIGEADVLVQHPELGKWVIELKSINNMQWRSLSAPLPDHKYQLNCYMAIKGKSWSGQVWYENKNTQELKLFVVDFDYAAWRETWQRVSIIANLLLEGAVPPMCDTCPDIAFCEDKIIATPVRIRRLYEQRKRSYPGT